METKPGPITLAYKEGDDFRKAAISQVELCLPATQEYVDGGVVVTPERYVIFCEICANAVMMLHRLKPSLFRRAPVRNT